MTTKEFKAIDRYGAEMEFEFIVPTMAIEQESQMNYRIAYGKALSIGVLPREKMREIMRENGIWEESQESELKDIIRSIAELEVKMQHVMTAGNDKECNNIAGQLAEKRNRMWSLYMVSQMPIINSCEGYADVIKQESEMAACVRIKANGQRYWADYKQYVLERDENTKSTVPQKAMEIQAEIMESRRQEIVNAYPEAKWLETIKNALFARKASAVAEDKIKNNKKKNVVK